MPFDPTQISGLLAWWDASRNQFSDAGATVPATYGGTVQSLVSRDVSASLAVTLSGATPLLQGGSYENAQSGAGIVATGLAQGLHSSLSVTRPYTLVLVTTGGPNATTQGYAYLGSSNTGTYITARTDLGGVIIIPGGAPMSTAFVPPLVVRHVFIFTCNSSGCAAWVDGINRTTSGTLSADWPSPILGGWSAAPSTEDGCFQHLVVYNSVVSNANITALTNYFNTVPLNVICDGNSLSIGFQGGGVLGAYPYIMANSMAPTNPQNVYTNVAISGDTTPQRTTAAPTVVDPRFNSLATINVVVIWEIINDMNTGGSNAAQAYANYQTYGNARKAANPTMKVVFGDLMANVAVPNTTVNALLAADFTVATSSPFVWLAGPGVTYGDMLIKFSIVTHLTDYTNTTYFYTDEVHLVNAGYVVVAAAVQTALGILATPAPSFQPWIFGDQCQEVIG